MLEKTVEWLKTTALENPDSHEAINEMDQFAAYDGGVRGGSRQTARRLLRFISGLIKP